jgi:protein arginine N-methyltransferase 5
VTTELPTLPTTTAASSSSASTAEPPPIRTDITALEAKWWRTSVVRVMSLSLSKWKDQLPWAWHMNLPAVVLPALPISDRAALVQYAVDMTAASQQAIKQVGHAFQLWIPLPLTTEALQAWQYVISLAKASNVGILLQIQAPPSPPPSSTATLDPLKYVSEQAHLLHTAIGCGPVMAVSINTDVFLTNKRGFPTLSKAHQWLVELLLQRIGRTVRWLVIQNATAVVLPFLQYLQHLRARPAVASVLDMKAAQEDGDYLDGLRKPLQPLGDHLLYSTYETFEHDPVKYAQYQEATRLALLDKAGMAACYVMVVGAGRGPLVTGVLQAYTSLAAHERPAQLFLLAVEKNPSAILYLQSKLQQDPLWKAVCQVQIVQADLRELESRYCQAVDIVVSKLLGSFGCNELSPECLDALLEKCRPETVSIPTKYTSYLAPISSLHIHHQIVQQQAFSPESDNNHVVGKQKAVETPYIVRTHAASQTHMLSKLVGRFSILPCQSLNTSE